MENENTTIPKQDESLEEEIKIEKPSYTYWKRESDKPFSNDFKPQISQPVVVENTNTHVGSAWNKAGTWEEKHLTKNQLENFFAESLKNKSPFADTFAIEKITSYTGDVSNINQ